MREGLSAKQCYYRGVLLLILSSFSFAVMNVSVRMAGDLPTFEKAFFRNLIAFLFAFFIVLKKKDTQKVNWTKKNIFFLILRSAAGLFGVCCNFYAIDHIKVADAAMLNKLSPFFVLIFSILLLSEKIKPFQLFCVILAFVGVLFIVKPGFSGMQFFPALVGLAGGMAAGFAYTCVRKLGMMGMPTQWIVFFFSLFSLIVIFPIMMPGFKPLSGRSLFFLLLAGFGAAGGQFGITAAYSYAPAREISIFDYSQLLFITLLSYFAVGEIPDAYSWIGYLIIILGSLLLFFYNKKDLEAK